MKRAELCRMGMAVVLLTAVAHPQTPNNKESHPLIVTDGMTTSEFGQVFAKANAMEDAKSCGARYWDVPKPFSLEELAGAKVRKIRVLRAETYRKARAPKPEAVRAMVDKVWSRKFGWKSCQIQWSEPTFWSILANLEFEDGKVGVLITDGLHVALQDHDGHSWFVV